MIERCLCPMGLACIAIFLAAFTAWIQAFPKWPVIAGFYKGLMGAAAVVFWLFVPPGALAQDMTRDDAKAEAEALAAGLEAETKAGATQTVDADSVPSFVTDDPAEADYFSNAAALSSDGLAASLIDEEALAVSDSIALRPIVTPSELATWTTNGLAIEADATSLVTEYGGTYGDCTTTVTGGTEVSYSYSCNEGETLLDFVDACQMPLSVSFNTRYEYRGSERFNDGDCGFEPDLLLVAAAASPACDAPVFLGGGSCGRELMPCGVDCSDLNFSVTCDAPLSGFTPFREIPGPPVDSVDRAACDLKDADPHCTFLGEVCTEGPETRVVDGQSVTRACWNWERSYQCAALGGVTDDCDVPPDCTLQSSTCLSVDDVTGDCRATEHVYQCTAAGTTGGAVGYCEEDVYCIAGDCETLTRPQNTEFPDAISALAMLGELESDVDEATLEIFPGAFAKCDKAVAGLQNCCSNDGFLTTIGFGCSADDIALADKQSAGLCHYVGTYCSDRTLFGICLKKRKTFCCFNNKLARLIHEQGRPQVGLDWGDTKTPDCAGFTVALFQSIDLSVMDFSEFYNDILAGFGGPDQDAAAAAITTRIINNYACPPNC